MEVDLVAVVTVVMVMESVVWISVGRIWIGSIRAGRIRQREGGLIHLAGGHCDAKDLVGTPISSSPSVLPRRINSIIDTRQSNTLLSPNIPLQSFPGPVISNTKCTSPLTYFNTLHQPTPAVSGVVVIGATNPHYEYRSPAYFSKPRRAESRDHPDHPHPPTCKTQTHTPIPASSLASTPLHLISIPLSRPLLSLLAPRSSSPLSLSSSATQAMKLNIT